MSRTLRLKSQTVRTKTTENVTPGVIRSITKNVYEKCVRIHCYLVHPFRKGASFYPVCYPDLSPLHCKLSSAAHLHRLPPITKFFLVFRIYFSVQSTVIHKPSKHCKLTNLSTFIRLETSWRQLIMFHRANKGQNMYDQVRHLRVTPTVSLKLLGIKRCPRSGPGHGTGQL